VGVAADRDVTGQPVMAVVRVKAPAQVDPHVLAAELTRAICTGPMSAELTPLPPWRQSKKRMRKHGFVAVLCGTTNCSAEVTRAAEAAARAVVRRRFGPGASAEIRPVRSAAELDAYWCSVRGTPHRP
jgi:hypothetical protein